jgi:hypothetical protein
VPRWCGHEVTRWAAETAELVLRPLQIVGSYGKQIGHLAEALEVVIKRLGLFDAADLPQEDRDAIQVFLGDVAAVRNVKAGHK